MTNFQLEEFAKIGEKLLNDTRKVFAEYDDLGFGEVDLPETMQPADGAVKLVFVGQYSAGKSSLIKMLSGIETEIGAGIKTQEAHSYNWNDNRTPSGRLRGNTGYRFTAAGVLRIRARSEHTRDHGCPAELCGCHRGPDRHRPFRTPERKSSCSLSNTGSRHGLHRWRC